ncbi:MAG: ribonucleoside reductase class II, partial [Methanobacteriota archaeon]
GAIESTNPCLTGDCWVHTDEGPRQVRELVGRQFYARIDGKDHPSAPEGFYQTGVKEVLKLATKEGYSLRLTADHPVKVVTKVTRKRMEVAWKRAGDLQEGDRILLNDHRSACRWPGPYTFDEGYLVGLLLGDGTFKKDKAVLSVWTGSGGVMERGYQAALSLPHRSDFEGWTKVAGRSEWRMSLGSLKRLALELGLRPGVKTITPQMEKASSSFCRGLLQGIFDCDGSVQGSQKKGVSIRLSQSDLPFLEAVQRMLLRLGVASKIYAHRRGAGAKELPDGKGGMRKYPVRAQHELVISGSNMEVFHRLIGFSSLKKMQRLEGALSRYRRSLNRERFIKQVKALEPDGAEPVYDVQIPGVNAFDANGFVVHNCGEQPLLPYESCNLGSVNLSKMVRDGEIDFERLEEVVRLSVRFLDNVIDASRFPLKVIERTTKANRKIGLGVMGFAEMLIQLGIPYDSEEALRTAENLMGFIEEKAHAASAELGRERGSFPNFRGSLWEEKGYDAMRNATVTTIAPTGTISIIAGTSSGIEPLFAVSFIRNVMEGTRLLEVNPLFERIAKERGFYSKKLMIELARVGSVQAVPGVPEDVKRIFVTALDIAPEWHVRMQAAFQRHVDNAVSKTVNLPADATIEDVRRIFRLAYELGCKGITVYRYGSKSEQVLSISPATIREEMEEAHIMAESEFSGGCPTGECF